MKFYQPIDGLLGKRRRVKRGRVTFGVFGVIVLGVAVYWGLSTSRDREAEARVDRIISLSAPDFTDVFSGSAPEDLQQPLEDDHGHRGPRGVALGHPHKVEGVISRNQTLFVAMREADVDAASIQAVVDALEGTFDFRRSRPGDRWQADLDLDGRIVRFNYVVSREEAYEAAREPDGTFRSGRVDIPIETVVTGVGGTVLTSVYDAIVEEGEDSGLASSFMAPFRWDVDFSRVARPGDTFRLLVEKVFVEGDFLRYGKVLAAEYNGENVSLRVFANTGADGSTSYYTDDGQAVRRTFLQAPLNYRRISSEFTRRRFHPVLNVYRAHLGVDYAAATGTPIWAVADGQVRFADSRGGNGNLVIIEHDRDYTTYHAHLSSFGSGIRRGREVRQGDVIGYVGNTGLSTGPHLHFGVRYRGEYIDPLGLQSEREPSLYGDALVQHRLNVEQWSRELDAIDIIPVDLSEYTFEEEDDPEDLPNDFLIHDESFYADPE